MTHVSHKVRALGVCCNYRDIAHWSRKCPQHEIIYHLAHLDQCHRVVLASIRKSELSILVDYLDTLFKFVYVQVHTSLEGSRTIKLDSIF